MKKTHLSPQYKELRDQYYHILKMQGFEDIEDVDSEDQRLKHNGQSGTLEGCFKGSPIKILRAEYFQLADQFLKVCMFDNDIERRIWEMHAEGLTMREITGAIATQGYSLRNVHKIIHRLRTLMLYRFDR